jgi:muramidase (phage lysozyme)
MIAWSEGTTRPEIVGPSDNGYNVLVGSTPANPLLFQSYADHPRVLNQALDSTAAGRYQVLEHWFDAYKQILDLPDFSPASQDLIAIRQIKECGAATAAIEAGNLQYAITLCAHIWASLPGNDYGQPTEKMSDLQAAYIAAGGSLRS